MNFKFNISIDIYNSFSNIKISLLVSATILLFLVILELIYDLPNTFL